MTRASPRTASSRTAAGPCELQPDLERFSKAQAGLGGFGRVWAGLGGFSETDADKRKIIGAVKILQGAGCVDSSPCHVQIQAGCKKSSTLKPLSCKKTPIVFHTFAKKIYQTIGKSQGRVASAKTLRQVIRSL